MWNIAMSRLNGRLEVWGGDCKFFIWLLLASSGWFRSICTYPANPLDSILFANSTSFEYTSYCHWRWPKMPAKIAPVWIPTRISTGELVFCCTYLKVINSIERKQLNWMLKIECKIEAKKQPTKSAFDNFIDFIAVFFSSRQIGRKVSFENDR